MAPAVPTAASAGSMVWCVVTTNMAPSGDGRDGAGDGQDGAWRRRGWVWRGEARPMMGETRHGTSGDEQGTSYLPLVAAKCRRFAQGAANLGRPISGGMTAR